jgi:peroxiredoxin
MSDADAGAPDLIGPIPAAASSLPARLPKESRMSESLSTLFGALIAERERNWPADQLARNVAQRRQLIDRFDPAAVIQPGSPLPPRLLKDLDGGTVALPDLGGHPQLLLFFRYAECPACSIALPYYAQALWPELRRRAIGTLAISPQVPERLRAIRSRFDLPFPVLSDEDGGLARAIGILFAPDDQPDPPPPGWPGEITGTGSWELPQPTALLIDGRGIVRAVTVSPDWLDRPEADEILAAVDAALARDIAA